MRNKVAVHYPYWDYLTCHCLERAARQAKHREQARGMAVDGRLGTGPYRNDNKTWCPSFARCGERSSSFSNWVISDALGFLIFTPTSLVVASGELVEFWKSSNRNCSLLLLGIQGVVTAVIFSQTAYYLVYWILPPLAVLAFQTELAVVLIGTLLCIAIAVPLTIHGVGPLWLVPFASMQERVPDCSKWADWWSHRLHARWRH